MRAPDPKPAPPIVMTCGNCCNAVKASRTVGHVVCTALPPGLVPRPGGLVTNVYPEMQADRLGCTVLWNVNAQLFHLLGQAVTLAANLEGNQHGDKGTENPSGS